MYKQIIILIFFLFEGVFVFAQNCHAEFNFTIDTNGVIFFYDLSYVYSGDSIVAWHWDFGDGTTADVQNPTHTYDVQGTYWVCLTINTAAGASDTYCDSVNTIPDSCTGFFVTSTITNESFYGANDGSIDLVVHGGTPPFSFYWDTGDTSEDLDSLSVGYYCVTVTDFNSCTYNSCYNVDVNSNGYCIAYFTYLPDNCPNCIEFYDSSMSSENIISWYWDFGNGNYSTLQNPMQTYLDSGVYIVTLTITTSDSCTSSYSDTIYIHQSIQAFSVSGQVFAGDNLLLSGTAQLYSDNFNESHPPFYSTQILNGSYFFPQVASGNYKLLAIPDSPESDEFSPTYFGDKTNFSEAYVLHVIANLVSVDIHLQSNVNNSENIASGSFQVYPVPFNKSLWIKSALPVQSIKIYSLTGELVFQEENINSKFFNIKPKLFNGIYLLKIQTAGTIKILRISHIK